MESAGPGSPLPHSGKYQTLMRIWAVNTSSDSERTTENTTKPKSGWRVSVLTGRLDTDRGPQIRFISPHPDLYRHMELIRKLT